MTDRKLSILIPFLNEGEEVKITVSEVRRTIGDGVDIIVVDDCSTDGRDYETELSPYNVLYIRNSENIGSAPSRDVCVEHCITPYFLFLDAHMRFYSNDWAEKIINFLDEDDRRILCAQTRGLKKDEKGNVIDVDGQYDVYGAYMPLMKGNYLPDIKWNRVEMNPFMKDLDDTAFILGAAYAGSKRYWKYLNGMSGLLKYGCEEQYICLKTWIEGGKVQVMKDVVIGHIYRDKSPYEHCPATMVHNYLWISQMFFTPALLCKSQASAFLKNRALYDEAYSLFQQRQALFNEQKKYLNSIATKSIDEFIHFQKSLYRRMLELELPVSEEELRQEASMIISHRAKYDGLMNGKMGQIIWLEHYYKYTGECKWDNAATNLWKKVCQNIEYNQIPIYFANGLFGIGWGLYYLYCQGFIDDVPYKVMQHIDECIEILNLDSLQDFTFDKYGGMLAYCSAHLQFCLSSKRPLPWNESFRKDLKSFASYVSYNSKDVRIISNAMMCKLLLESQKYDGKISLSLTDCLFSENFDKKYSYCNHCLCSEVVSSLLLHIL